MSIPDSHVQRAENVFRLFADQWGVPVSIARDPCAADADIRYGAPGHGESGEALEIPFDPRLYDPDCVCTALRHGDVELWSRPDVDALSSDLVGSTYRLLTFLDERPVDPAARDRRGVFTSEALPAGRRATAAIPVVDDQAAFLLKRLDSIRPGVAASARPNGRAESATR